MLFEWQLWDWTINLLTKGRSSSECQWRSWFVMRWPALKRWRGGGTTEGVCVCVCWNKNEIVPVLCVLKTACSHECHFRTTCGIWAFWISVMVILFECNFKLRVGKVGQRTWSRNMKLSPHTHAVFPPHANSHFLTSS